MFSYWIYVLIGMNNTGKTSFQRHLVNYLCNTSRRKKVKGHWLVELRAPQKKISLFVANRSYQEVAKRQYKSVEKYLNAEVFNNSSRPFIVILSSHSDNSSTNDIKDIVRLARHQCYNIAGVFFSNDTGLARERNLLKKDTSNDQILNPDWDERLWVHNPNINTTGLTDEMKDDKIQAQIEALAIKFGDLLIHRTTFQ